LLQKNYFSGAYFNKTKIIFLIFQTWYSPKIYQSLICWQCGGLKVINSGGGVNSSMIYLIYCKKLCKCHNVQQ
jgi:hypothetical protein